LIHAQVSTIVFLGSLSDGTKHQQATPRLISLQPIRSIPWHRSDINREIEGYE